ncbi:hypothetical protein CFI10_11645 [Marinobacterium iners]|uniref:hypothetical protein n=1 Tax=Marinobacterium iners TaxID=48076 RepID=UPI001A8C25AF|nr:hypothetical protein [Marinobacterium iners]QSR35643.1 hypothetical protein CFI10_11645 [Marinobacterium iners]
MNIKDLKAKKNNKIEQVLNQDNQKTLIPKVAEKLAAVESSTCGDYSSVIAECKELLKEPAKRTSVKINDETTKNAAFVAGAFNKIYNTKFSATSLLQTLIYQLIVEDINEVFGKKIESPVSSYNFDFSNGVGEFEIPMRKQLKGNKNMQRTLVINMKVVEKLISIYEECAKEAGSIEAINFRPQPYLEAMFERRINNIVSSIKMAS